jgi:hypothetical protein
MLRFLHLSKWCQDVNIKVTFNNHLRRNTFVLKSIDLRIIRGGSWASALRMLDMQYDINCHYILRNILLDLGLLLKNDFNQTRLSSNLSWGKLGFTILAYGFLKRSKGYFYKS